MRRRDVITSILAGASAVSWLGTEASTASDMDWSLSELEELIELHREEMTYADALWQGLPVDYSQAPQVQICRVYAGRGEDGEPLYNPVWAYTREDIETHMRKMKGTRPDLEYMSEKERRAVSDKHDATCRRMLADFDAQVVERKRVQDASGFTDALQMAHDQDDKVRAIETDIINYVPGTLAAASRKAEWAINVLEQNACLADNEYVLRRLAETLAAA